MADGIENLVLEHLRAIGARSCGCEGANEENTAAMNRRLDSMDDRIERIEKRLGLVEA
jgi:hypothetical protein